MEFTKENEKSWKAQIDYRELWFWAYGSTKQEAGSNCMTKMQEYIDEMQEALNKEIK